MANKFARELVVKSYYRRRGMQNTFINDGGQKVYQKYLDRYHRVSGDKHSENRNQPDNYVTRRFVEESHNLFFYNAFNMIEAKRPVQNVYKRPI